VFDTPFSVTPIGVVRSPYAVRHGTPQQAALDDPEADAALPDARIELFPERIVREALDDLEGMERIWVIAFLHLCQGYAPKVKPPRGAPVKRGVFSTRSPHRPNPLGLSAVRLIGVEGHVLHVRGIDLLDGTPVLDIKPYVPYADAFPDARAGWIETIPKGSSQYGRGPSARHKRAASEGGGEGEP
jgi:tRNA (adenine37-N6)-methyltransferase